MNEEIKSDLETRINQSVMEACQYVTQRDNLPDDAPGYTVIGACKDYNAKGNKREHWFRMVFRDGSWQYVSNESLPSGNYLASERYAIVSGKVWEGEITLRHEYKGDVCSVCIVRRKVEGSGNFLKKLEFTLTRNGSILITLPNNEKISLPNPRKK